MEPSTARDLWHLIETVHAVTYFSPQSREAHSAVGFKGFWMGYFGARSAPMGAVDAGVVTATFANFDPLMVQRAIPDAWDFATPEAAVEARAAGAAAALRAAMEQVGDVEVEDLCGDLAGVLDRAVEAADPTGRPLFAANRDVIPFEDPVADVWQMCTSLREHRGDGHVAILVAEGLGGCEPHILFAARHGVDQEMLRGARGWSEADWADAVAALTAMGLVADGTLTERGRAFHDHIEARTDGLAAPPYAAIGEDGRERLRDCLIPLAAAVVETGWLPFPNPVGLPEVV